GSHSLILKSDGTVIGWGNNLSGQAVSPAGLSGVIALACGEAQSIALKSDGTVVGWGYQSITPSGLTGVNAVAAGGYHAVALKSDGSVVAWGSSDFGAISVPSGLTQVTSIATGSDFSLILREGTGDTAPVITTHPASRALNLSESLT